MVCLRTSILKAEREEVWSWWCHTSGHGQAILPFCRIWVLSSTIHCLNS